MSTVNGTDEDNSPPNRLPSDTVQLVFLFLVLLIGLPSNSVVFHRILAIYKNCHKESVKAGFLLLNLNLAVSDIMLLVLSAFPKMFWNLTYEWKGTDGMCKAFKYLSMASYYLSSNIIVCIAVDRLRNVLGAKKIRTGSTKSIRCFIIVAWLLAFIWALPQLIVFQTLNVMPEGSPSWIQCSDVWTINIFRDADTPVPAPEWLLTQTMKNGYELTHLLLVFWGPLVALATCYVIIAIRLARLSTNGVKSHRPSMEVSKPQNFVESDDILTKLMKRTRESISSTILIASFRRRQRQSMITQYGDVMQPTWRRRLRGKLFRSTLLIVAAHFLLWFPYNFASLVSYLDLHFKVIIAMHAYVLNDLQILITLVNPILYAITQ